MGQDGVCVLLAVFCDLVRRHAVDTDTQRDRERGALLDENNAGHERGPQLVGRVLRVDLAASPERAELRAVD